MAFLLFGFSCVKEYSLEHGLVSSGSLQKDANGNCLPLDISGTLVAGKAAGDANQIDVSVSVASKGRYIISSDTVNGYCFNASGNFGATGTFNIELTASGTPVNPGTDHFTITYDGTTCEYDVLVLPNPGTPAPAAYTLQGAPAACMNDSVWGGYVVGVLLDTSNHVDIEVNVTKPGTWTIMTDTVDGYFFAGSGTFTAAGIQTVRLAGSGTPEFQITDLFKVRAGASTCSFPVKVEQVINTTNPDHFPLTAASFWNYDYINHGIINRTVTDTTTINANVYTIVQEQENVQTPAPLYFRKQGNGYFEYARLDKYTISSGWTPAVYGDIHFLSEGLNPGDTWISGEYSGTLPSGQTTLLQYTFACVDTGATVVINGTAFSHVYKITMAPQVRSVMGSYNGTGEKYIRYYAKGVGLIFDQLSNQGYVQSTLNIRNWLVN